MDIDAYIEFTSPSKIPCCILHSVPSPRQVMLHTPKVRNVVLALPQHVLRHEIDLASDRVIHHCVPDEQAYGKTEGFSG